MIGSAYQAAAVQAVLGPGRAAGIPSTLWSGWLDASLAVLAMTGLTVSHDALGATATGVANTATVEGGTMPATVPAYFGLFDAATGGELIAYAAATFDGSLAEGTALSAAPGALAFDYTEA